MELLTQLALSDLPILGTEGRLAEAHIEECEECRQVVSKARDNRARLRSLPPAQYNNLSGGSAYMTRAVVLGASGLAFGFVVPALAARDVEVVLFNRLRSQSGDRLRRIDSARRFSGEWSGIACAFEIASILDPWDPTDRTNAELVIKDPDTRLIVACNRGNLASFLPLSELE